MWFFLGFDLGHVYGSGHVFGSGRVCGKGCYELTECCSSTPGRIDLEDEDDVGTSLTLIRSEDVVLVPDEDKDREDEDDPELDEAEDLEDLEGKRVLPILEVIIDKNFSHESEILVSNVKTKSQTVTRSPPNNPIGLVTLIPSEEVTDGRDTVRNSWSTPADDNVALTTPSSTWSHSVRRTSRPRVTVPPRFRHTVLELPEGRRELGFGECCCGFGTSVASVTNKSLSFLVWLLVFPHFAVACNFHLTT